MHGFEIAEAIQRLSQDVLPDSIEALVQRHPDKFALLRSPRDVARRRPGVVLLPFGMENGAPIGSDIRRLQFFYNRGVRYITLAHSKSNHIADSSYDTERKWHGLSPFGELLIADMNKRGVMVDVSHVSDEAFARAVAISQAPVIASHSSARHFTPGFERNPSDELIRSTAPSSSTSSEKRPNGPSMIRRAGGDPAASRQPGGSR